MTLKVMVSSPYMRPVIGRLKRVFDVNGIELVLPPVRERLSEEELLPWVKDVDGVICGDDHFTERVLKSAPHLKVISKWGTGIDSIDIEACEALGIKLFNTLGAFTEPVADTVLGYVLCFARRIFWLAGDMQLGKWEKRQCISLRESTLGIIGVGNIGKAVARRSAAFGMRLLGNDVAEVSPEFIKDVGIRMVSLDELLSESDFVSVNCDLNPTSLHLLGEREFSLMKPTAYVINTARGPIIDEKALIKALKEGGIAGAALDVFEEEPLPEDSPLRRMSNMLLAPHNANSSPVAWERVHKQTINNLLKALNARHLYQ